MTDRHSISVFVPALNEAGNLEGAIRDIVSAAEEVFDDYEVLIVDDGSTDHTGEEAEALGRENPKIRVIRNPGNLGFDRCHRIALARAEKKYFVFLPGDHEIAGRSVREIFGAVGSADLVVAYIQNRESRTWRRRVMGQTCVLLSRVASGVRLRYFQGPVVYPTALARVLPSKTRGLFTLTEKLVHALKAGCTFVEVGLIHQNRAHGRSKAVSVQNILMALRTVARLWWKFRVRGVRPNPYRPAAGDASGGMDCQAGKETEA